MARNDPLGDLLQYYLGRLGQSGLSRLFAGRDFEDSRILWSGRRENALFEPDTFNVESSEALVDQMTQESGDFVPLSSRLDPGNSDVRAERSGFSTETELVEKLLSLLVDELYLTPTILNSHPDDIHPLEVRKRASPLDLKREGRECYLGEGRLDFVKFGGADVP